MADPISDERLRDLFEAGLPSTTSCMEIQRIAAELLAARAEVERLRAEADALNEPGIRDDLMFLNDVRRENQRLRADHAAAARVLPPCCGSLADAAQEVVDERDAARAELAAVDAAISDRGVPERDCRLPLAERVDNILGELKAWRWEFATAAQENDGLRADLREAVALLGAFYITIEPRELELLERRRALLEKHKETNQ